MADWKKLNEVNPEDGEELKKWFEEMNRQFEEDSKYQDFSISQEWDADFKNAMFGERTKKTGKNKARKRLLYAVASVVLLVIAGLGVAKNEVIGDNLEKIFNHKSNVADSEFEHFGTKEEMMELENDGEMTFDFKDKMLTDVYMQMKKTLKRPIFQMSEFIETYEIEDAFYKADYNLIVLKIKTAEGMIFVSQREVLDNSVTGTKLDESSIIIWNDNLQQNIIINKSIQDESYSFSVKVGCVILNVNTYVSKELSCEIAKNLSYN